MRATTVLTSRCDVMSAGTTVTGGRSAVGGTGRFRDGRVAAFSVLAVKEPFYLERNEVLFKTVYLRLLRGYFELFRFYNCYVWWWVEVKLTKN